MSPFGLLLLLLAADPATSGKALFAAQCAGCHGEGGEGGRGPALTGVIGKAAGSGTAFPFSAALSSSGLHWDAETLDRFLAAPTKLVPGTTMVVGVAKAGDRAALITYLTALKAEAASAGAPQAASDAGAAPSAPGGPFADWHTDAPGRSHRITLADLPAPYATRSARNNPRVVRPPAGALPQVPQGFQAEPLATGLSGPRELKVAPNGDVFVAESKAGRVRVLRGAGPPTTFADRLDQPFGLAFYPPGPQPRFLYVAETNRVVRFAYQPGDLKAHGPAETLIPQLTPSAGGGHWTRDLAFSPDGKQLFVSVGSASNVADEMDRAPPGGLASFAPAHALGATWGEEAGRADVRVFDPDGHGDRVFASGLRNCVGLSFSPGGDLWCAVNERDGLGDDLVPDYLTRVKDGAFYGWPWFYLGNHPDPRRANERPDLADRVTVPDVLVQPHAAALQLVFYAGKQFPAAYRGDGFATFHGSWNRGVRAGYKVVRLRMEGGQPTGQVEDFLTGFVADDSSVWGRPVGVAVAADGALLVSEDGNGTIWRVSYQGH